MAAIEYPNLDNLTVAEQREYWQRALKNIDALALESYINCTMEPDNKGEARAYEVRVKAQSRLRAAHAEWLKALPEDEDETPDDKKPEDE
jgi:hypothetical protein